MSRVAKQPVTIPSGVDVRVSGQHIAAKGAKGASELDVHPAVSVEEDEGELRFQPRSGGKGDRAMAGTMRSLAQNLLLGVSEGFEKKLELRGIGYRAQAQGQTLNLTLGFSHPVDFPVPDDISVETPTQTEVVIRGVDKQRVGQVAAEIRGFRPPEPYKGKGVRYVNERVVMKEAKKK